MSFEQNNLLRGNNLLTVDMKKNIRYLSHSWKLGQRAGPKFYEDCEEVVYFCARIYPVLKFPPSPCTKAERLIAEQNSTL